MVLKRKSGSDIVVWAIDPFEGKIRPHPFEVRNLQDWMGGIGVRIQPIYILNLPVSNPADQQNQLTAQKTASVEAAMKNYLYEIGCSNTLSPKVLVTYDTPVGGVIERLIHYCDDVDAEMIIVSSRGRKGFDRFIFGSFAEGLLFQTKRPLYFLTHQNGSQTEERNNKVLFPTDFSEHSELVFEAFLKQVELSGSEVILYSAIALPPSTIIVPENYFSQQEEEKKAEAQKWIKKGNSIGVKVSFLVQNVGGAASVAPSIIEMARQKSARFIAMASSSGKVGSIFFGSVARDVFRANLFPVWVCGKKF